MATPIQRRVRPSFAGRRVGLALGAGGARGLASVGVIRVLQRAGIEVCAVAGTSAGAFVGAVHAAGEIDRLADWLCQLHLHNMARYADLTLTGGVLKAKRMFGFISDNITATNIEDLPVPFAAVATDIQTGEEVWLRCGDLVRCLRGSAAIPGLVPPVRVEHRLLADGALVNPVPVNLCRALGAEVVIAVDIGSPRIEPRDIMNAPQHMSALATFSASLEIMQRCIAQQCRDAHPADLTIRPDLRHIGRLQFYRAAEVIAEGERAAEESLAALEQTCEPAEARSAPAVLRRPA